MDNIKDKELISENNFLKMKVKLLEKRLEEKDQRIKMLEKLVLETHLWWLIKLCISFELYFILTQPLLSQSRFSSPDLEIPQCRENLLSRMSETWKINIVSKLCNAPGIRNQSYFGRCLASWKHLILGWNQYFPKYFLWKISYHESWFVYDESDWIVDISTWGCLDSGGPFLLWYFLATARRGCHHFHLS